MKKVTEIEPVDEVSDEISSLIEILHKTEQRLEHLTDGQVDSVSDASGRTFVLRRAQEQLRRDGAARQATNLNALQVISAKTAQRERMFSTLLSSITDQVFMLDREGRFLFANQALLDLWGLTLEQVVGKTLLDLVEPSELAHRVHRQVLGVFETALSRRDETSYTSPSGSNGTYEYKFDPVLGGDGKTVDYVAASSRDITERKQSQKMEALGQLAAGVAHEFNNLLQALMSMATITRLRADKPEISKLGAEMEMQIRRGAVLTQQLLVFSRQHALQKEVFDLREQVDNAIGLLRRLLPGNIKIVLESAPERLSMEGDGGQVQQVILNLAINARDAMPDGGTLTLRNERLGDQVFLDVEDSGEGMSEATRARIFEPFFTTKEVGKGTGLGLAVVYGIVEQHGGRIDLRSSPGEGSRFRMFFPAISEKSVPLPETAEESADMPIATGRVLLVEDEPAVREGIVMLLEMIGHRVTIAGSAEEALKMPMELAPDVLLSDVSLPGLGGLALAELLCSRWPALKVIMMSGYMPEGAAYSGWRLLQKPFEMEQLASLLAVVMKEATLGDLATINRNEIHDVIGASTLAGGCLVLPAVDGLFK